MNQESANVIAKPPYIFLSFIAAGVALNYYFPATLYNETLNWPRYLGILLMADGLFVVWLAMRQFRQASTPVDTSATVKHIVTRGIYRYTRNPIYLGMFTIYLGLSLDMNNAWLLGGIGLLLPVMMIGVVLREERYLENLFQDEYREYRSRVRRWI